MASISTDILIIGAGPGGLACAKLLAEQGRRVLVLERKKEIGPKVCAGGITWDGLIRLLPENLIERSFCEQHVYSSCQRTIVREKNPIIATVSRRVLGQWMVEQAQKAGAEILPDMRVRSISGLVVTAESGSGRTSTFSCSNLVGADGANSLVRRNLGIPALHKGPGINFQVPGICDRMEWHLDLQAFGAGYAWIFPHKETISIGAYSPQGNMSAGRLKRNFLRWAEMQGYQLHEQPCLSALINYDYRGHAFGPVWLVGDAAGLASGLTGEGIYPAVVSGEAVAQKILDPHSSDRAIGEMVRKQQLHRRVTSISLRNPICCLLLMEMLILFLRCRLVGFRALEMADPSRSPTTH